MPSASSIQHREPAISALKIIHSEERNTQTWLDFSTSPLLDESITAGPKVHPTLRSDNPVVCIVGIRQIHVYKALICDGQEISPTARGEMDAKQNFESFARREYICGQTESFIQSQMSEGGKESENRQPTGKWVTKVNIGQISSTDTAGLENLEGFRKSLMLDFGLPLFAVASPAPHLRATAEWCLSFVKPR
ncbi:hypothetical protein B0H19DRAFT_1236420 [Mycena capillaripes]|nr:hypothetical protein B0H19DRAFT_1236420 [Mycena capillaripes]